MALTLTPFTGEDWGESILVRSVLNTPYPIALSIRLIVYYAYVAQGSCCRTMHDEAISITRQDTIWIYLNRVYIHLLNLNSNTLMALLNTTLFSGIMDRRSKMFR
jgi:hypothetical protein